MIYNILCLLATAISPIEESKETLYNSIVHQEKEEILFNATNLFVLSCKCVDENFDTLIFSLYVMIDVEEDASKIDELRYYINTFTEYRKIKLE